MAGSKSAATIRTGIIDTYCFYSVCIFPANTCPPMSLMTRFTTAAITLIAFRAVWFYRHL